MSQEIIEGYRLSPQQRHLWSLRQSDRSAVCAVQINGELNIDILKRAIYQVVGREEILRTTFKLLPGMTIPVQVISDHPDVAFVRHDLAQLGVDDQEVRIRALFVAAAERKIDYSRPPLFRVDLIARSSTKHVLILGLPALCVDAPSLQCLVRKIAAAYTAYSKA